MKNMEDKKICPKCGREEKVKNGFNRGKHLIEESKDICAKIVDATIQERKMVIQKL